MIFFWLKEAIKLIGRAKSSFFLSLISISISVFLIIASLISIQISNEFQQSLKRNVNINIFLKDSINVNDTELLQKQLNRKYYISSVNYISKDEAARNFVKETGEDFRTLLDYNPLPASFQVALKDKYVEKDSLNKITAALSRLPGVDDVVFQQQFVYEILSQIDKVKKYIFVITAVLFFIAIYIVYSTIKLIIKSKYDEMETMKLVGAKLSTIKMPIVLNGIMIGLLAGIISLAAFYSLFYYFDNLIELRRFFNFSGGLYIVIALLIGPVIGSLVSLISLRKISLKI
ncbi:MAG: permease-like cell division protein FtsX [Ignavibacteriaceae bacterium]|nr:permease-like cell division protein FtsX [Ignavibacteriaceae bacterium]